MRRLLVSKLVPGMKVGRNVYGKRGEIWLARGAVLTRRYIDRLVELEIPAIYIDDGLLGDVDIKEAISEETRQHAVQQVKALFSATPKTGAISPPPAVFRTVEEIVRQVMSNPNAIYNLLDIRAEDEYLFYHSVNVCILATVAGANLGWNREQLEELALGALLHDVGKVRVPPEILNKPGELSKREFDEVKKHTVYGEEMLETMPPEVRRIARSHHERLDGTGYPDGISDIPATVQLTGLADVYDALTAERLYRRAYQPHEAFEMIAGTGNFWFDHLLVQAFLFNIAAFPVGSIVSLSSGAVAVVVENKPGLSLYPKVRVLFAPTGEKAVPAPEFWCHEEGVGVLRALNPEEVTALGITPHDTDPHLPA
ncbi:MAG: HD-GYP domain-containing protein [Bacillota bacterium]